jgi:MFS transporter, PAT family, beta-lactamase induction signal transducer AmpG
MAEDNRAARHPPPWLFGLTGVPYGIGGGFAATTMPFFARKAGFSIGDIGWYGTALLFPPIVQFLYAPIVDLGPKRKHWLVIVSVIGAICYGLSLTMPLPSKIGAFLALAFAGGAISGLSGSCNGGLLATTMPDHLRGAAGGWLNVGNLTGGALGAWLTLVMAERYPPLTVGIALMALMVLPSLAVLAVHEPDRERRSARTVFSTLWHDVKHVVRAREGWTGMLLFSSPVGTAALINYFAGMAPDFRASDRMVAFINGPVNGLVTAAGSLIGGYLCDRYSRRGMYLLSAGLTALCGLGMMASPLSPTTYAVGVGVYLFITGFCYAAFSAAVLETIGKGGAAASTQYALFVSCGNLAINYVGLIDTRFDHHFGPRGLLGVDALLNVVGIVALTLLFRAFGGFRKREEIVTEAVA